MSPLSGFLIFIVSITALFIVNFNNQFQEENIIYSNKIQMKNKNLNAITVEKEKIVTETHNGIISMISLIAAVGAYLTTGQIIPWLV